MKSVLFILGFGFAGSLSVARDLIKIACVGNSITDGNVLPNPSEQVWVTLLQDLFSDDYDVQNFGRGAPVPF